jgi:hypothetical protein
LQLQHSSFWSWAWSSSISFSNAFTVALLPSSQYNYLSVPVQMLQRWHQFAS